MGAMTDPSRNVVSNVGSWVRSSPVGQIAGSAGGTPEQSVRDNIKNARGVLLQAIKEATGMSAQQMNSNVELQLWLNTVTDPTQSYKTVTDTLANLDKVLAKSPANRASGPVKPPAPPGNPPPAPGGAAANDPLGLRR